jgi:hypothetical protein
MQNCYVWQFKYLNITLADKHINTSTNIKFLGLTTDDKLSWKSHIGNVFKNLSSACYAIRSVTPLIAEETLRTIYFAYAHSILSYGTIFVGQFTTQSQCF